MVDDDVLVATICVDSHHIILLVVRTESAGDLVALVRHDIGIVLLIPRGFVLHELAIIRFHLVNDETSVGEACSRACVRHVFGHDQEVVFASILLLFWVYTVPLFASMVLLGGFRFCRKGRQL